LAIAALLEELSAACDEVVSLDEATAVLELLFCAGSEFPVLFCVHPANNPNAAIPNKIVVFFMFHSSNCLCIPFFYIFRITSSQRKRIKIA
jgi:hypothetical protein